MAVTTIDIQLNETNNKIPITGTELNNPITGSLEFQTDVTKIYCQNYDTGKHNAVEFLGDALRQTVENNTYIAMSTLNSTGLEISSTSAGFVGYYSVNDYSTIEPNNKLIYAQRSYVERPETLINCLNNCTQQQIVQIKDILQI